MSFHETVTGMVLAATPVGDYDKRLVILTGERGKITVFARGAKKPTSQFLACSQPFTYGKFTVYEGKNAYTLNSVTVEDYFVELREDLELIYYGLYFCELADYYSQEGVQAYSLLKLMCATLSALRDKRMPVDMIKAVCQLKMSAINGEAPFPSECVKCGEKEKLAGISFSAGGAVCPNHLKEYDDVIVMEYPAIYAVYYVIVKPEDGIYSFKLDEKAAADFIYYVERYMKKFVHKEFTSLELLKMY